MTKSRQSAIKLRLSRLVRGLVALGCLKLAIMGVALCDLPMPAWFGAPEEKSLNAPDGSKIQGQVMEEPAVPVPAVPSMDTFPATVERNEPLPQGSAAAELAAASRPRRQAANGAPSLPAPLVAAGPASSPIADAMPVAPLLPMPPRLEAPLAKAGIILPEDRKPVVQNDASWNILDLKSLPIPGLGSVQVAHAAALDMPVPQTTSQASPFTPAAQVAPMNRQPTVLPGAPPLPSNLPRGQGADGAPLPPRQATLGQSQPAPTPVPSGPLQQAPAPQINAQTRMTLPSASAQELARQQQDVLMLRQQMDQRLKELQNAEGKMKDMLREAQDIEDKKVKGLVQMYANMKPRMAAQALENMDERIAVRILSGMAPKQSGEILTYTNPAKTAKFTEMITRLRLTN